NKPLHIDARQMNGVGVEAPDGNNLFDLCDADLRRGRHRLVEVAHGLAEDEVPALVCFPALDDRKVCKDAAFEDIVLAVERADFLALGDRSADAGSGVKSRNTRAASAAAFRERTLRAEFDLEFACEILPLEFLVLADIGGDHLPDLARAQELAEPFAVDAGIVARDGEVLDPGVPDRVDQPLGYAAKAKATSANLHSVEEDTLKSCRCVGISLVRHDSASCH